jgi:ABC-type multidrug transport system fused ATPase/permease subunit
VFALIAVVAALINFTQLTAFTLPGSRLTSKLRARCFASMLRQPIGFFDRKVGTRTPPPPRTKWTRRVPPPVLIGHAAPPGPPPTLVLLGTRDTRRSPFVHAA